MLQLSISAFEDQPAQDFLIRGAKISIGRSPDCDLCLNSGVVSARHAEIVRKADGSLVLVDGESRNGTTVNDKPITKAALKEGDCIRFGDVEARLIEADVMETVPSPGSDADSPSRSAPANEAQDEGDSKLASEFDDLQHGILEANPDASEIETLSNLADSLFSQLTKSRELSNEQAADLTRLRVKTAKIEKEHDREQRDFHRQAEELKVLRSKYLAANGQAKNENSLRIQVAELKRTRDQSAAKIDQQVLEIQTLKQRLGDEAGDDSELQASVTALHEQVSEISAQRVSTESELAAQSEELKREQEASKVAREQHAAEIAALKQRLGEAEGDDSELQASVNLLHEKISEITTQRDAFESDLAAQAGEVQRLSTELEAAHSHVEQLQGDEGSHHQQVVDLVETSERQVAEIRGKEQAIADLSAEVEKLRESLRESESAVGKQGDEDRALAEQLDLLRAEHEANCEKIAAAQQQVGEQQVSIETQTSALEEKDQQLALAKAELKKNQQSLSASAATIAELRQAAESDRETVAALESRLEAMSGDSSSLMERAETAEAQVVELRAELEPLEAAHADAAVADKNLKAIRAEISAHKSERQRLATELADHRVVIEKAKAALDAELVEARTAVEQEKQQLETLAESMRAAELEAEIQSEERAAKCRAIEKKRKSEEVELTVLEAKQEASQEKARHALASVEKLEAQRRDAEAETARQSKLCETLKRKIGRRAKLLLRLKTVGRRERALKKQLVAAEAILAAAEANKPGQKVLAAPQPWDFDHSEGACEKEIAGFSERSQAMEGELHSAQAELEAKREELLQLAERIRDGEELERELRARQAELAEVLEQREAATMAITILEQDRAKLVAEVVQLRTEADAGAKVDSSLAKAGKNVVPHVFGAVDPV